MQIISTRTLFRGLQSLWRAGELANGADHRPARNIVERFFHALWDLISCGMHTETTDAEVAQKHAALVHAEPVIWRAIVDAEPINGRYRCEFAVQGKRYVLEQGYGEPLRIHCATDWGEDYFFGDIDFRGLQSGIVAQCAAASEAGVGPAQPDRPRALLRWDHAARAVNGRDWQQVKQMFSCSGNAHNKKLVILQSVRGGQQVLLNQLFDQLRNEGGQVNIDRVDFTDLDFSGLDFRACSAHEARLIGTPGTDCRRFDCNFRDADLTGATLYDLVFHSSDLSGARLNEASIDNLGGRRTVMHRVEINQAKIGQLSFRDVGIDLPVTDNPHLEKFAATIRASQMATGHGAHRRTFFANFSGVLRRPQWVEAPDEHLSRTALIQESLDSVTSGTGHDQFPSPVFALMGAYADEYGDLLDATEVHGDIYNRVLEALQCRQLHPQIRQHLVDIAGGSLRGMVNVSAVNNRRLYLDGVTFSDRADLTGLDFSVCSLVGTTFRNANLGYCIFSGVDLRGAQFDGCTFLKARLDHANLGNARIRDSEFSEARMCYADLRGVTWQRVKLERVNLFECHTDDQAVLAAREKCIIANPHYRVHATTVSRFAGDAALGFDEPIK